MTKERHAAHRQRPVIGHANLDPPSTLPAETPVPLLLLLDLETREPLLVATVTF